MAAVGAEATAFAHRGTILTVQYGAEWQDGGKSDAALAKIASLQATLAPLLPASQVRA